MTKSIYEILRQKELLTEQLQKEIDALRLAIKILEAENVTVPGKSDVRPNGNGALLDSAPVAISSPAKRFP